MTSFNNRCSVPGRLIKLEYKRILAVGDIHGNYGKLSSLYAKIEFNPRDDLLVFLGDYVAGGDSICDVMDFLIHLKKKQNVIFIRGNTDEYLMQFHKRNPEEDIFDITSDKYKDPIKTQDAYWDFLNASLYSYIIQQNNQEYFFCHAGIDFDLGLEEQDKQDLLEYNRDILSFSYKGEIVIVVGHTQVCKLEPNRYTPIVRNNIIMMDTSAKRPEGKLSCMDVLSGKLWQSD